METKEMMVKALKTILKVIEGGSLKLREIKEIAKEYGYEPKVEGDKKPDLRKKVTWVEELTRGLRKEIDTLQDDVKVEVEEVEEEEKEKEKECLAIVLREVQELIEDVTEEMMEELELSDDDLCYRVLMLDKDCSNEEVKTRFRRLSSRYHPDNKITNNVRLYREVVNAHNLIWEWREDEE